MHYFRNRYYDSELGRFTTPDPIISDHNAYGYCRQNPVMCVDATGLFPGRVQPPTISIPGITNDDALFRKPYGRSRGFHLWGPPGQTGKDQQVSRGSRGGGSSDHYGLWQESPITAGYGPEFGPGSFDDPFATGDGQEVLGDERPLDPDYLGWIIDHLNAGERRVRDWVSGMEEYVVAEFAIVLRFADTSPTPGLRALIGNPAQKVRLQDIAKLKGAYSPGPRRDAALARYWEATGDSFRQVGTGALAVVVGLKGPNYTRIVGGTQAVVEGAISLHNTMDSLLQNR